MWQRIIYACEKDLTFVRVCVHEPQERGNWRRERVEEERRPLACSHLREPIGSENNLDPPAGICDLWNKHLLLSVSSDKIPFKLILHSKIYPKRITYVLYKPPEHYPSLRGQQFSWTTGIQLAGKLLEQFGVEETQCRLACDGWQQQHGRHPTVLYLRRVPYPNRWVWKGPWMAEVPDRMTDRHWLW